MIGCITSLAAVLQALLCPDADRLARDCGLVRRRRRLDGPAFAQALVFGWLADPDATLEQLAEAAAGQGLEVSPQAIDQRISGQAVDFFERLLAQALDYGCQACPDALPLLGRFEGVYVFDTTRVSLPASVAGLLPGQGGSTPDDGRAACALQVCLELSGRGVVDLQLGSGRTNDLSFELAHAGLPEGALRLADRGFADLGLFARYDAEGVYWLSRLHPGLGVSDESGRQAKLDRYLGGCDGCLVDRRVWLGARRLPARLVAVRLSEEAAARRRQQLRRRRQKKGEPVSAAALALCEWDVTVTNVPRERLSAEEVIVLRRLRWQVELLFKVWKGVGGLGRVGDCRRERVLVELYAKLLGQLVQGWHLLASGCTLLRWSWYRCAKRLRAWWGRLGEALGSRGRLTRLLGRLRRRLRGLRKSRRRKQPAAFEALEDPARAHHAQQGAWALS